MGERGPIYRRRDEVRFRVIDGEAVVVLQQAGEVMVLNPTGARILDLLDGRRSLAEIVDLLEEELEGTPSELDEEVSEFLDSLLEAGVVEPAGEG